MWFCGGDAGKPNTTLLLILNHFCTLKNTTFPLTLAHFWRIYLMVDKLDIMLYLAEFLLYLFYLVV